MKIRKTIIVRGLVQGVNFRYFTKLEADSLGVSGWVMNLPDGSVAGCFEGDATAVEGLVAWCRRGPDHARVDSLSADRGVFTGEFFGFAIRR